MPGTYDGIEHTLSTEADFVSINVELNLAAIPSLRPYFNGGVPHDNVTQHNSTNDAVLNMVPFRKNRDVKKVRLPN